ncbi:MAG TPA: energy-coupling factor transporter transmembrane component T [Anaerolineales bacterium]|nr:energy-coupling factor transporter transmembrane component T [Anaerolineales bacterium]
MNLNRSFFVPATSFLHALNPFTKLTLVFAVIALAFFSLPWMAPALLLPIFLMGFLGKVQRQYLNVIAKLILPAVGFMFVMQSLFLPDGETILFSIGIFDVSLETVRIAFLTVSRIFVMISAFILLLLTTHPSELMSDLTRRGLPPQFAYVIISTLQILPQMQAKAQTIISAQRSRGLETQGNFFRRVGSLGPLVGPLVFGSLVEVEERAIAIEARGFTSTHVKTSLYDIPDTNLDRALRWMFAGLVILSIVLKLWLS